LSFYVADLYTLPSVETGTAHSGLQFEYINNGVYEGKGLNQVEANRVADAIVLFAKEQLERQQHGERMETLGVGTFNLRQQLAIQTGEPYQRPVASPYASTPGEGRYVTSNIFGVPLSNLVKVVALVVETESPIHKVDLFTRVAAMWGLRAGWRIQARILTACESAERGGITRRPGDFYWSASSDQKCPLRSRSGTKIPADRIADEEYQEAICAVLSEGHAFSLRNLLKRAANSWNQKEVVEQPVVWSDEFSSLANSTNVEQCQVNVAIHFNSWDNLDKEDFQPSKSISGLFAKFACPDCGEYLRVSPERETPEVVRCVCGKTNMNLKKNGA
jgi:hypothetical protein